MARRKRDTSKWTDADWAAWEGRAWERVNRTHPDWDEDKKRRWVFGAKRAMGWEPGR